MGFGEGATGDLWRTVGSDANNQSCPGVGQSLDSVGFANGEHSKSRIRPHRGFLGPNEVLARFTGNIISVVRSYICAQTQATDLIGSGVFRTKRSDPTFLLGWIRQICVWVRKTRKTEYWARLFAVYISRDFKHRLI